MTIKRTKSGRIFAPMVSRPLKKWRMFLLCLPTLHPPILRLSILRPPPNRPTRLGDWI
jgi:hypothetical protein